MSSEIERIILHVDIDAFYPSVEIREKPPLLGLPVVVVSKDPKQAKRGVVISASYEARKLGIRAGMPISRAQRICPEGHFLQANFPLYIKASEDVMNILRSFSDRFEQVSIDEAFIDLRSKVKSFEEAKEVALKIKNDLKSKTRLTCSIGIAPNKSSAKIASDLRKPDGLTVVRPSDVKKFLVPLPVSSITGVGKKTEEYLNSLGIKTIGELQALPPKELVRMFGKTGVWLWGVAHGLERLEVKERLIKSISVEHTFQNDVSFGKAHTALEKLGERLAHRIIARRVSFRVVGLKVRFAPFDTHTHEKTIQEYTNDPDVLLSEIRSLLREFKADGRKMRMIGIYVSGLRNLLASVETRSTLDAWTEVSKQVGGVSNFEVKD